MWSALRSDLTEFVSTVKEDTSTVLNKMDANFPDAERDNEENEQDNEEQSEEELTPEAEECLRRMELQDTFTAPLLQVSSDEIDAQEDDDDDKSELKEFLESFSIESKTDDIAQLLETYPDTLKVQFETLVPTPVTYEDFWKRYFYRCDEERIAREWAAQDERVAKARAEALSKTVGSVRNFLGGAVQGIASSLQEIDDAQDVPATRSGYEMTANQAEKAGFFGASGRPPFVLNTAVDEDDDEEEEELGWDDDEEDFEDDDDDEEEEEDNENQTDEEQIEFSDQATEALKEELKQALEERDQLQQTVEMQTKEIAEIKEGKPSGDAGSSKEIENLKTQLFEKESELAAMRASMLDDSRMHEEQGQPLAKDSDGKVASLEVEVERLSNELKAKESELSELRSVSEKTSAELDQLRAQTKADKAALDEAAAEKKDLESKLATLEAAAKDSTSINSEMEVKVAELEEAMASLQSDNDSLRTSLEEARGDSANKVAELQQQLAAAQENVSALTNELEEAQAKYASSEKRADGLDKELASTRANLQVKEQEAAKLEEEEASKSVDSPETVSTGVKIDTNSVGKLAEEEEMGEGWDDDW